MDMAREGMHHQVLELLLAHQFQRSPVPMDSANEMMWEERALMYSQWVGSQGLPGRSASFSGIVGHRDMTPPPQKYVTINMTHTQTCLLTIGLLMVLDNHSKAICTSYFK